MMVESNVYEFSFHALLSRRMYFLIVIIFMEIEKISFDYFIVVNFYNFLSLNFHLSQCEAAASEKIIFFGGKENPFNLFSSTQVKIIKKTARMLNKKKSSLITHSVDVTSN